MSHYIIDIEGNGLLENILDFSSLPYKLKPDAKLWCVVIRNVQTNEIKKAVKDEITKEWMREALADCTHLVAHNGIKFDFIVLKLFGVLEYRIGYPGQADTLFGKEITFVDTLILSRLFNPDRYGGHSLDSWGQRVGNLKTDFRQACIDAGLISRASPSGAEFGIFSTIMVEYCEQDTSTNRDTYLCLLEEYNSYSGWNSAIKMENKLADLAVRRESFGFWFDKKLAIECVHDLTQKIDDLRNSVNPQLPLKPMNKGELSNWTPPKNQFKKDGSPSSHLLKFVQKIGGELALENDKPILNFEDSVIYLPSHDPLKTHVEADISDLDHVKMYLIDLDWNPTEWRERDLTKDAKKQNLPYEKRVAAAERWVEETLAGKYKTSRLKIMGWKEDEILDKLKRRLEEDRPVRVPTSPCVRVGVEKELCPSLIALGEKVAFAKDFALYLTYKHRKASIAGGDIEEMDLDKEYPNTGFLSMYREVDERIPTPAIEIGASTNRYRHIGVCNIARASSIYGKELRSLFGSGPNGLQFGYDFSSLENRIQGSYVYKYEGGPELADTLIAEKPNDLHTLTGKKLGISRVDAKSVVYALLYGASANKIAKMLSIPLDEAKTICDNFWNSVPPLKQLKENLERHWETNSKVWIKGIDGRKIFTRSKHSLLNSLFQSGGVICAKYVNIYSMQILEEKGHKIDCFESQVSVNEMIAYHDECQLFIDKSLVKFEKFQSEDKAKEFVENWKGNQLSAIAEGANGFYITYPNDVSQAINDSIRKVETELKLSVPLGFEYIVHKNWYGCH